MCQLLSNLLQWSRLKEKKKKALKFSPTRTYILVGETENIQEIKDDFFSLKGENKSGKGIRKYVVCMCVCRVGAGVRFKEREQNRLPWKNNTEVKTWKEHMSHGAKHDRRAELGGAVGKCKGPEAGAGLQCPRRSRRLNGWSEGLGEVTSECWWSALEILP